MLAPVVQSGINVAITSRPATVGQFPSILSSRSIGDLPFLLFQGIECHSFEYSAGGPSERGTAQEAVAVL
eukprot:18105-Pyramimonas_sp.AAC.1